VIDQGAGLLQLVQKSAAIQTPSPSMPGKAAPFLSAS